MIRLEVKSGGADCLMASISGDFTHFLCWGLPKPSCGSYISRRTYGKYRNVFFLLGNIKFLKEQIMYITLLGESWERKQYHSEMHESFASIDDDQTSSEMEIIPD